MLEQISEVFEDDVVEMDFHWGDESGWNGGILCKPTGALYIVVLVKQDQGDLIDKSKVHKARVTIASVVKEGSAYMCTAYLDQIL